MTHIPNKTSSLIWKSSSLFIVEGLTTRQSLILFHLIHIYPNINSNYSLRNFQLSRRLLFIQTISPTISSILFIWFADFLMKYLINLFAIWLIDFYLIDHEKLSLFHNFLSQTTPVQFLLLVLRRFIMESKTFLQTAIRFFDTVKMM